ncbi:MAG: translation initiation factor IF-2 subunit alpha [Candidatus Altiarchaeales archaeon ex4484_43]|nr:MAG: translation initiation factor IF-2 subunit alpha [Candidatus Altiarchaeales archaeon ex4484_43]
MAKETKDEYPRAGELVLGTVESIFKQGAFITLDEYGGKRGMLHLSEISLKWVRNIRDYVREGQKVVLLVLRVNPQRGHIDLSLRRVTEAQRKEKLQEVKQKQRAKKLLELLKMELGLSANDIDTIEKEMLKKFDSVYGALEAIAVDNSSLDGLEINEKWKPVLLSLIKKSIKAPFVNVTGYVKLKSYESNGINIIRKSLKKIKNYKTECDIDVTYISAPLYRIKVRARDYKSAERVLRNSAEEGIAYMKRHKGEGEFHRKLDSKEK